MSTPRPKLVAALAALVVGTIHLPALAQLVTQPPPRAMGPEDRIAAATSGDPSHARKPAAPSLVKRGAVGRLIPLAEPIEQAALRINPLVTAHDLEQAAPVLSERRLAFRRIVFDNLDLAEQVEGGLFETIDLADNKAFARLIDVAMPLKPASIKPLSKALEERGILTREQAALNDTIAQEYKLARVAQDATGGARRSLALMYKQSLDEPRFALREARQDAANKLESLIPKLTLDQASTQALLLIARTPAVVRGDGTKPSALDQVNAKLTLDQRKRLLREAATGQ
jgi:hypothetical protein